MDLVLIPPGSNSTRVHISENTSTSIRIILSFITRVTWQLRVAPTIRIRRVPTISITTVARSRTTRCLFTRPGRSFSGQRICGRLLMTAASEWIRRATGTRFGAGKTLNEHATYGQQATWKSLTLLTAPTFMRAAMRRARTNHQRWSDSHARSLIRRGTMSWLFLIECELRIRVLRRPGCCTALESLQSSRQTKAETLVTAALDIPTRQLSLTKMAVDVCEFTRSEEHTSELQSLAYP